MNILPVKVVVPIKVLFPVWVVDPDIFREPVNVVEFVLLLNVKLSDPLRIPPSLNWIELMGREGFISAEVM
jgi:hypothetical protein